MRDGNPAINLRSEREGTAHRLHFTAPEMVAAVADFGDGVEAARDLQALALAHRADMASPKAGMVAPGGASADTASELRGRIIGTLNNHRSGLRDVDQIIPEKWWKALRELDGLLEAVAAGAKLRVGDVNIGDVQADPSAAIHGLLRERRANEAVMTLRHNDSDRLRDVFYAFEQSTGRATLV